MNESDARQISEATALTWGLLGASVCAFMIRFEPNLLEEGLILHVAQRMVHGEALYRDVASFTGPLPFELLTALFRIFGEEIAVARGAVVVLHGLACASVYAVALRAGAGALAHAAAACVASAPLLLFPLVSLFFHTTLAFHLCLIAAYPAVRATRSVAWALVAGVVIAFAALCKQTVGVVLAAGLLAAVASGAPPNRRIRQAFFVAFGGASIALITVAAYGLRGDLGALVQSIVILPLSFDETFSTPFVNFWPPGVFSPDVNANRSLYLPSLYSLRVGVFFPPQPPMILATQLLYALPFIGLAATALGAARGRLAGPAVVHAAVLLALTTNLFPRTDWGHLVFALPPAIVQLLLVVPVSRKKRRSGRPAIAAALVLALVLGSAGALQLIIRTAVSPRFGPRVPQRPVTSQLRGRALATVIHYLRRHVHPGEPIFVARSEPLIYFATDTRNPTPYSGVIPGMREEQETAILAALEQVRYVVMSDIDQPIYTYYREELPRVQAFLERHFRHPADFPLRQYIWITVLERGPDRGETIIDLFDEQPRGRPWIRDGRGVEGPPPEPAPKLATKLNRRPLPMLLGPGGGGIDFDLELPEGAIFQAGIGMASLVGRADLYAQAEESRFQVSVATDGEFEKVDSVYLVVGGMTWKPFEVDLSAYGGERVTLRLELVPDAPRDPDEVAFWGSPRIALRLDPQ